jgi:hypothetical protein
MGGVGSFSGGGASTAPVLPSGQVDPNAYDLNSYQSGIQNSSTVLGGYDPFYGTSAQSPSYGSMPDYSQVGADPMAGLASTGSASDPYAGLGINDPYSNWWNDTSGYQPTTSGTMYTGDTSGYTSYDPSAGDISDPNSAWWD